MHLSGLYRGVVTDAQDPTANGRVKVRVPELGSDVWAAVCSPFGGSSAGMVNAGTQVVVGFERGDPSRPIVLGRIG
jgi:uncharacterized protein involved in type VI secretion and phage assembly